MSLIFNGDWNTEVIDSTGGSVQWGDAEWGGTFDGTPPLSQRLTVAGTIDGFVPREGARFAKFLVAPGDQYGASSGERTLLRQYQPIVSRPSGWDSTFAFSVLFPTQWGFGLGGSFDAWQIYEWHGSAGPPACVGIRPQLDTLRLEVKGGTLPNWIGNNATILSGIQSLKGIWIDILIRQVLHESNGTVQVWTRVPSQASTFTQRVDFQGIPTLYTGQSLYLLCGLYGPALSVQRWIYLDAHREYSTFTEAHNYMLSLSGGGPPPAEAPTNTVVPAIGGAAIEDNTLVSSTGTWTGTSPITYGYQWRRCDGAGTNCANISSATSSSYLLVQADVGSTIRSRVTATNSVGSTTADSAMTSVVADSTPETPVAPVNTVVPTVAGTAVVFHTLVASTGTWTGSQPITYTYQWRRCNASGASCSDIGGATSSTYTLASADLGSTVRCRVTATNSAGFASADSAATAVVTGDSPEHFGGWSDDVQFNAAGQPPDPPAVSATGSRAYPHDPPGLRPPITRP